jgi:NADP-dependent 3-hydroxy acid dehydrogenase YdfG
MDLFRGGRYIGETVVVTGGVTGIGKRIAEDLYNEGALRSECVASYFLIEI